MFILKGFLSVIGWELLYFLIGWKIANEKLLPPIFRCTF